MMPVYEMLKAYRDKNPTPFHMPGHVLGRGFSGELKSTGFLDITEIPGSDCLHKPTGVLKNAQDLAARCFGSGFTLFLVNGSTCGIHAMIQAVINPGGKLITGRDCHRSVLNTLAMINAEPIFVIPEFDTYNNIPLGITGNCIKTALRENPDAQGILITRPNYYGISAELGEIVETARKHGIPLLIDEAHGAHFKFHSAFPATAMETGADLCVQSLHKTLPALTQTALLHCRDLKLFKRVETTVSMVQTTSPSYLLMASIDIARNMMENEGRSLYSSLYSILEEFDKSLSTCAIKRIAYNDKSFSSDFSRIVLSFKNTSLNGYQAEELLRMKYGIIAEMADINNIVLISTPFHTREDFKKLLDALFNLSAEYSGEINLPSFIYPRSLPDRVISLREALFMEGREVPIKEAGGMISSVSLVPYPPGIPIVNPGEIITSDIIEYIEILLSNNCPVHGIDDGKIRIIDKNI